MIRQSAGIIYLGSIPRIIVFVNGLLYVIMATLRYVKQYNGGLNL